MAKIVIITQARLQSSRFPQKVLKKIGDKSLLQIHLERLKKSKYGSNLVVATTFEEGIEELLNIIKNLNIYYFQGSTENVLNRFYKAAKSHKPDFVVRVTSDCPLIDPILVDEIIEYALSIKKDYVSNTLVEAFPDGQDIEVFKFKSLETAWKKATSKHEREHVTPYIRNNSTFFRGNEFTSENFQSKEDLNHIRMTVDELSDFEAITTLVNQLGTDKDWKAFKNFITQNPSLFKNQGIIRNEGSLIKKP